MRVLKIGCLKIVLQRVNGVVKKTMNNCFKTGIKSGFTSV